MKSWVALAALIVLGSVSARSADPAGSGKLYPVRGAMLYVRSIGHGRPILFLHGGMQFFDNALAKQRDFFAVDHRIIGIDQRGHGHSPDGRWPLSYQMMADDSAAIIQKLGVLGTTQDTMERSIVSASRKLVGARELHDA